MEGQQEDVATAERRFESAPKEPGMLFTNGTGTGKTFTGLGVVKRFARRGKNNILIVAPNDKIGRDWVTSGEKLGLTISALPVRHSSSCISEIWPSFSMATMIRLRMPLASGFSEDR